jgi:hypothetical protein
VSNGTASSTNGCGPAGGFDFGEFFGRWDPDGAGDDQFGLDLGDFVGPCNKHDCCWGKCGAGQAKCDHDFFNNLGSACASAPNVFGLIGLVQEALCREVALTYYQAVSSEQGTEAYNASQGDVCSCCCDCPPDVDCDENGKCLYCNKGERVCGEPGTAHTCCKPEEVCCIWPDGQPHCCPKGSRCCVCPGQGQVFCGMAPDFCKCGNE